MELTNSVAVYVPNTTGSLLTDNSVYTQAIAAIFSRLFGGATVAESVGYWQDDTGKLIQEPVSIVKSFSDSLTIESHSLQLAIIANYLKTVLRQEAISVEIDNTLIIIE